MADPKNEHHRRQLAAAISRMRRLESEEAFDAAVPSSRPTPTQMEILTDISKVEHQYVRGGNQTGKSQLGARVTSWIFQENHPYWSRPAGWGDEPLLILVLGRTTKQIEETLWRKISGFMNPEVYKIQRVGGVIQKVTHVDNGNTIIFLSHHSENEAREKVQSFVAHMVWLDEMPGTYKLIEELHRRVQARSGYFLATFTPKVMNNEIRRLVDHAREPLAKSYVLKTFDNPIYDDVGRQKILDSLATMPEGYRNTILHGDWLTNDDSVYYLDQDTMVRTPKNYDYGWRHVESVDPALKSALGLTVWAEDPATSRWYCVKAKYLKGILVPTDLVEAVRQETYQYNIVRRISDPHEVWYIQTAASMGVIPMYQGIFNKANRKGELIKNFQEALGNKIFIAPWCEDFISELQECRWSESQANTIINQHAYHITDSAQYFVDAIPAPGQRAAAVPVHQYMYEQNEARKLGVETKKKQMENIRVQRRGRGKSW